MGYEAYREHPGAAEGDGAAARGHELSPINPYGEPETSPDRGQPWPQHDFVRPWDSLTDDERRLFCRMAEVFAGFVSHTDHQIGRMIDYLEESGQLENTIVVVSSDNGASGEGGPNGSFNENKFFNSVPDTVEDNLAGSTSWAAPSPTTTTTPAGPGRSTRRSHTEALR